jgi:hypothetical protein
MEPQPPPEGGRRGGVRHHEVAHVVQEKVPPLKGPPAGGPRPPPAAALAHFPAVFTARPDAVEPMAAKPFPGNAAAPGTGASPFPRRSKQNVHVASAPVASLHGR